MNSILARNALNGPMETASFANRIDGLVARFIEEAADPKVLAAITVGSLGYRASRGLVMGSEGLALKLGQGLRPLAVFSGLGVEVSSFEGVHRGLSSINGDNSNPNLWNWNGEGGWAKGLATSAVTFGSLKGAGALGTEENLIFQHVFQASAMVSIRFATGALGLVPKPQGGIGEQFLEAETTNLQLSAGMGLAYRLAPEIFALERGLDLSLAIVPRATGRSPLQMVPALASLANDGINPH
jgi:hypothetical protein